MSKNPDSDASSGLVTDQRALQFLGEAAYMALARGELEAAEAVFRGLVELLPDDPVGHLGLAEVCLGRLQSGAAESAARRAAEAAHNTPETLALAYELRGSALYQSGRNEDAEAAMMEAAVIAPDSPSAINAKAIPELMRRLGRILEASEDETKPA